MAASLAMQLTTSYLSMSSAAARCLLFESNLFELNWSVVPGPHAPEVLEQRRLLMHLSS